MTRTTIGLGLVFVTALIPLDTQAAAQDRTTFARDIAPLLHAHCVTCHRPGAVGPFSLLTYDDARGRAEQLADVTARGLMPPWLPHAGRETFQGARGLAPDEIERFRNWADAGAPAGDLTAAPPVPQFASEWQLGEPDLILQSDPLASSVAAGRRTFVLSPGVTERQWIRAVEVRPQAPEDIRHVRVLLDATGNVRAALENSDSRDELLDAAPGYSPRGHVLDWTPGAAAALPPASLAWPLNPGTDIVLQVDLRNGEAAAPAPPELGLHFSEQPAGAAPVSIQLTSRSIDIPPGEPGYTVQDRYRLPVAVHLHAVAPFARDLGRRVESRAILPDGSERTLLQIDDWAFDRLDKYRYVDPPVLPAGTVVTLEFTFDNSSGNPRNPTAPPVAVRFGQSVRDERADLHLQVTPASPGDREALERSVALKAARDRILGFQAELRRDPADPAAMTRLAREYIAIGETDEAVVQLQAAIAQAPDYAAAHVTLGSALIAHGQIDEAIEAYRRAIEIQPDYAEAHNALGVGMESSGKLIDAEAHYRLAIQFHPRNVDAHYNLARMMQGRGNREAALEFFEAALALRPYDAEILNSVGYTLVSLRRYEAAVAHYRRALAIEPDFASSLLWLAWIRATAPVAALRDARAAVRFAERAAALLDERTPLVLDILAAAYAADGQFDLAVTTAREAASRAREQPEGEAFAAGVDARVNQYLLFRPYRMPAP